VLRIPTSQGKKKKIPVDSWLKIPERTLGGGKRTSIGAEPFVPLVRSSQVFSTDIYWSDRVDQKLPSRVPEEREI
jgi:hypothetical protein